MAIPVSIEITSNPVTPGQSSELEVNVSEPVTATGGETYTVMVDDPNNVLAEAIPVSITIGKGNTVGSIPLVTNSNHSGHATFSIPAQRLSATLDVAGL